jgi:hypothetical protein
VHVRSEGALVVMPFLPRELQRRQKNAKAVPHLVARIEEKLPRIDILRTHAVARWSP